MSVPKRGGKLDAARHFLRAHLSADTDPVQQRPLFDEGIAAGHKRRTLQRALRQLVNENAVFPYRRDGDWWLQGQLAKTEPPAVYKPLDTYTAEQGQLAKTVSPFTPGPPDLHAFPHPLAAAGLTRDDLFESEKYETFAVKDVARYLAPTLRECHCGLPAGHIRNRQTTAGAGIRLTCNNIREPRKCGPRKARRAHRHAEKLWADLDPHLEHGGRTLCVAADYRIRRHLFDDTGIFAMVVRLNVRTLTVHEAPAQPAAAPTSEWDTDDDPSEWDTEDTSTRRPRKPTSRSRNADGEDCDRHYTASFGVSFSTEPPPGDIPYLRVTPEQALTYLHRWVLIPPFVAADPDWIGWPKPPPSPLVMRPLPDAYRDGKIRFYRYRLGQYVLDHRPDADDATVVALVLDDRLPKHSAITPDALLEIDATVQRILRDEYESRPTRTAT